MSTDRSRLFLLYRVRRSGLAVAVVAGPADDATMPYRGVVLGLTEVFDHVDYVARVPTSVLNRVVHVRTNGTSHRFSIDDGLLADEVVLREEPLLGSNGLATIAGFVINDDEVVDVVALDDPMTLAITVIGAITLLCLARLGLSHWLADRADARRVQKGARARVVIDGSTDGEVSMTRLGKLKAKLRCRLRVEILDMEGRILETYQRSE